MRGENKHIKKVLTEMLENPVMKDWEIYSVCDDRGSISRKHDTNLVIELRENGRVWFYQKHMFSLSVEEMEIITKTSNLIKNI